MKQHPSLQNIPVVVFTTSVRVEDKVFFDLYNVAMIEKPLSINHLRDAIEEIAGICSA
ncbi:response regulator [Pseudocnuella soli]|uniref:hypothetical protein n=1 Tax=Pseudocnuella soli TaxID=2502779 RepID=UPI00140508FA|nr:hypothetical protein [Pseudocnuella soli]